MKESKPQTNSSSLKQWAEEDRPREKLMKIGRSAMSNADLLAILIGSGSTEQTAVDLCREILYDSGQNLNELGRLSITDLMKYKGIGEAKAITIIAALELGRRRENSQPKKREYIRVSNDCYRLLKAELSDLAHEEFWVVYLRQNNSVIKKERLSVGGLTGTTADGRVIFRRAIENKAASIVLAHNHPSGNLRPSTSDIELTKRLKKSASLLDIKVIDHIIITCEGYTSLSDKQLI